MENPIDVHQRIESVAYGFISSTMISRPTPQYIELELAFRTYNVLNQLEMINWNIDNEVRNDNFSNLMTHITYIMFQHGLHAMSMEKIRHYMKSP